MDMSIGCLTKKISFKMTAVLVNLTDLCYE